MERLKTMFGVKVGDEELGEYVEKEANVWGQAEIGDEAKEVLNLEKSLDCTKSLIASRPRLRSRKVLRLLGGRKRKMRMKDQRLKKRSLKMNN